MPHILKGRSRITTSEFNNDTHSTRMLFQKRSHVIHKVTNDYVAVTNSMNFVNSLFLTDLIESREQFREERDNLSLVLYVIAELCESNHVCEEQSLIFELVHLSLFIFYNIQNVEE